MLSVTDLTSYLYCKRKLFFSKKLKIKVPVQEKTTIGSIYHKATELFYSQEPKYLLNYSSDDIELMKRIYHLLEKNVVEQALAKFRREIVELKLDVFEISQTLFDFLDRELLMRVNEVYEYAHEHYLLSKDLVYNLYPKISLEVFVKDPKLDLLGRVDRILVYPDEIVPVEFKTSSRFYDSFKIQAIAYGLMLKDNSQNVKRVRVVLKTESRDFFINPFHEVELKKLIDETNEIINSNVVPEKTDNPNKCKSCPYKDICDKYGT